VSLCAKNTCHSLLTYYLVDQYHIGAHTLVESEETVNNQHVLEQPYIRCMSEGRVVYQHPTAGRSYGKGRTLWEIERDRNNELRGGNRWAMWGTQDKWESAKWMTTTKVSQSSVNKLLKTKRVREQHLSIKKGKLTRFSTNPQDIRLDQRSNYSRKSRPT
jgi:hypothetical protein